MSVAVLPASFAQERLWLLDQLQPGRATYNMTSVLRLRGRLDVASLGAAVDDLVSRHEALRTTFRIVDGRPMQVVHDHTPVPLVVEDLSGLFEANREATMRRTVQVEANTPFDLAEGPLLRCRLVRLSRDEHVAVLVVHHIVSDGWSQGVMVRDLGAIYAARVGGRLSGLSELPIQYADYAQWQREWLAGPVLERQLAYWRGRLRDLPPPLELPGDGSLPAAGTARGGQVRVALPPPLVAAVELLSRREQATPFMTLLAAFQVLLARYTGTDDLVVGTPVANRTRPELEELIGFFVNTLVLRADLSGDPDVRTLLARTRRSALEAFDHQDLPFERLVEALAPQRDLERSPLFQVLFVLQNAPSRAFSLPDLEVTPVTFDTDTAKFDLTLDLAPAAGGGMTATFEFSADRFSRASVVRLAARYQTLLEAFTANPDACVSTLPLLTAEERQRLLVAWNDTATPGARTPLHAEILRQARATPDAHAVESDSQVLTYAKVAARVERLATRLQACGVGPDVVVGLCGERSPELIVALLAIVAAGGAVLPLDPAYPASRLTFMLDDAGAPLLLVEPQHASLFAETTARVLGLDGSTEEGDGDVGSLSASQVDGSHLIYVIYTSGSTGTPKGVAFPHEALRNLIDWQLASTPLGGPVRTLQFSALGFDASFQEIFSTIGQGGTLVLLREAQRRDPEALFAVLHERRIERWFCPFVALRQLAEVATRDGRTLALREILTAGEALQITPTVARFFEMHPALALHNYYGPSETHVVTAHALDGAPAAWETLPPIGRPIANTQTYVLDRRGMPVPVGVPGELYLGGVNVARGYLGRPGLTAERFVPDAWSGVPGARLYRTGDLVKWRADGRLLFLGRLDHQVKVRGFRVEIGEVEAALEAHPAIVQAAVDVQEVSGEKRLVAYIVSPEGSGLDGPAIAAFLRERLPDYMVPGAFVPVERFPLTPSGKIDRRALPAAGVVAWGGSDPAGAPRSPLEAALVDLLAEVLGVERLGVHDGFFERGGHSLLAVQVMARVRAVFDVELPLRVLFESPTVAGLAARVEQARALAAPRGTAVQMPTLRREPAAGPLPLSFGQARLWLLEQLDPGSGAYHLAYTLRLTGALNVEALRRALREVVWRHEVLRTRIVEEDGEPYGHVVDAGDVPLAVVDLRSGSQDAREAALRTGLAEESARPYALDRGDVLHVKLWRLADEESVAFLGLHHIVADAWSLGVLLRELEVGYAAALRGSATTLSTLSIQYADYARWQRQWLTGDVLTGQIAFWRSELAGAPLTLELPADRPRPARQLFEGGFEPIRLDEDMSRRVRALAARHGVTTFMALLAAFQALLARLAGAEDLLVGTPVANRTQPQTEPLIGFFVNTLVLRGDLRDDPTFADLLAQVKARMLNAMAYQELPFERLVETLDVPRDQSRTPVCQVMFSWQQTPLTPPRWPGLRAEPFAGSGGASKFDVTLMLGEDRGRIAGGFEYAATLFDAETVRRWGRHLVRLLDVVTHDPSVRVAAIDVWEPAEWHQVVVAWNDTAGPRNGGGTLLSRITSQARSRPDALALIGEGERRTFGELDRLSNRLAWRLRAAGVEPEVRVGVLMERACELIESALGILKAGGVYVPLDPSHPRERLEYIVADADVQLVVTQRAWFETARALGRPAMVWHADESRPDDRDDDPGVIVEADQLAYIIYTSGSTGRPKGAMNTHAGLTNRIVWMQAAYDVGPGDCVLHKTPISFDVSIWELFLAPLAGARLVLARPGGHEDPSYLAELIAREGVTLLHFVPSMLEVFLHANSQLRPGPRCVICSGEALSADLQARFFAQMDGELHNLYGPTEAAVDVTGWACERQAARRAVPIGRPIDNTTIYLLDADARPVPVGIAGELHIGGVNLARGYAGRPDLTAERFVPNPFGPPGSRLYRTGDRARYLNDGAIEFLGRTDQQVKMRGVRIELGEIETALRRHPAVHDAVVVAVASAGRSGAPPDRLVAYVTGSSDVPTDAAAWRAFLRTWLTDAMVPQQFAPLTALPRLASGKIDRRALPTPPPAPSSTAAPQPATTDTEAALVAIWAEALRIPMPGVADDFFALGGHSLLAVRVLARVRERFGVGLPLRALFDTPTVAALAACVDEVRFGRTVVDSHDTAPALVRVPAPGGRQPLSFGQERLWFIERLAPGSGAYHVSFALRFRGDLDHHTFERALGAVVARHDSLRTRFVDEDGTPAAQVEPARVVAVPLDDLRTLDHATRDSALAAALRAEAARPYALAEGDVLHVRLWRVSDAEFVAHFGLHHIVADAWSLNVLVGELAELYDAYQSGRTPALPAIQIQYGDYARWQRATLSGARLRAELDHWRQALQDAPLIYELPPARRRPAQQSVDGAFAPLALDAGLSARVRSLARAIGGSPFMVLLAAFQVLLGRCAGVGEVLVGTPVANRERPETAPLIGFFVNTLVMRGDLRGNPTFAELLARVKAFALDAYTHQDVPFERLVDALDVPRDLSRSPVCQVMFVWHHEPQRAPAFAGISAEGIDLGSATAKFDVTLTLADDGHRIAGGIEYATALYDADTMHRLGHQLVSVLEIVTADPNVRVAALDVLDPAERRSVTDDWACAAIEPVSDADDVVKRFEEMAAQTPGAVAVACGNVSLDYAELDARANQLAHRLRALGVAAETCVGICVPRSLELIVALLGVLKAGGAYVPLDRDLPAERRAFILRDAGIQVLVRDRRFDEADWPAAMPVADLDDATIAAQPSTPPVTRLDLEGLAYVLYTSGSTGQPKGVMVTRRNLASYVRWAAASYVPVEGSAAPLHSPLAFDLTVTTLFTPLAMGRRIDIAPPAVSDVDALLDLVRAPADYAFVKLTPAHLRLLAARFETEPPRATARVLVVGGEALLARDVAAWRRYLPATTVINEYGPTEATVGCVVATVADVDDPLPIGRPITNTRVYVLDDGGQPVPTGAPGLLYIGGAGVSRGYVGQPALTAERFVPDPFSAEPGSRMYRSGDRARWRGDGQLEYLGRLDDQIKLRGHRVELGEVEIVLAGAPGVAQAAVTAVTDPTGEQRLVGYVVAREGNVFDRGAVEAHLRRTLPGPMIPAVLVPIAELPLTHNGKVDRRRLPAPDEGRGHDAASAAGAAPRDALEQEMLDVWREVLGVPTLTVHDNFFARGGHSLAAVRLAAAVERRLKRPIRLADVFSHPTVEALAEHLRMATFERGRACLVSLHDRPSPSASAGASAPPSPLILVHPALGSIACYAALARSLGAQVPISAFQAPGLADEAERTMSVAALAQRYLSDLLAHDPQGPYRLGGWSFGGLVAYEMACHLRLDGRDVECLVLIDTPVPGIVRRATEPHVEPSLAEVAAELGLEAIAVPDEWRTWIAVYRTNLQEADRYAPGNFDGELLLVRASESIAGLPADYGWGARARRARVEVVPGDHYSIIRPPSVERLAAVLRDALRVPAAAS